jgi:hypothetical protein
MRPPFQRQAMWGSSRFMCNGKRMLCHSVPQPVARPTVREGEAVHCDTFCVWKCSTVHVVQGKLPCCAWICHNSWKFFHSFHRRFCKLSGPFGSTGLYKDAQSVQSWTLKHMFIAVSGLPYKTQGTPHNPETRFRWTCFIVPDPCQSIYRGLKSRGTLWPNTNCKNGPHDLWVTTCNFCFGFLTGLTGVVLEGLSFTEGAREGFQREVPGKVETRFGRLVIARICRVCLKERAVAMFLAVDHGAKHCKTTIFIDETPRVW